MRWLILLGDSRCRVLKALLLEATIAVPAIGKNVAAGFDLVGEELLQRLCGGIENHFQSGKSWHRLARAAMLHRNGHHGFGPHAACATPAPPLAMLLTTHIALINLHQAAEPVVLIAVAHRLANLVQHQPRGGVTDADFLGQLHRRDALLVVAHAIDRPKPTAERGPRLVKDGPGCHRALIGAKRTLVHLACCHVPATRTTTTRALKPFGPPLPAQLLATLLLVSKRCTELLHRHHPVALRR